MATVPMLQTLTLAAAHAARYHCALRESRGKNHGTQLTKIFKPSPFNSVQTHFFAHVKKKPL